MTDSEWRDALEIFEQDWFITDVEREVLEGFLGWWREGLRPVFKHDPRRELAADDSCVTCEEARAAGMVTQKPQSIVKAIYASRHYTQRCVVCGHLAAVGDLHNECSDPDYLPEPEESL